MSKLFTKNFGWVGDNRGTKKDITLNYLDKKNVGNVLIGGVLMLAGLIYTAVSTFTSGAKAFDKAEWDALADLDLVDDVPDSPKEQAFDSNA